MTPRTRAALGSVLLALGLAAGSSAQPLLAPRQIKQHLPLTPDFLPARLADLDGDGFADAIDETLERVTYAREGGRYDTITALPPRGVGLGTSTDPVDTDDVGDLNGDGFADLVRSGVGGLEIVFADSARSYSAPIPIENSAIFSAKLIDHDGDGHLDLAIARLAAGRGAVIDIRLNDGTGQFAAPIEIASTGQLFRLVPLRLNADQRTDLIGVAQITSLDLRVFSFRSEPGTASVANEITSLFSRGTLFLSVADFDGDGDDDLVGALAGLRVWENRNELIQPSVRIDSSLAGPSVTGDFDADGNQDIVAIDGDRRAVLHRGNGDRTFTAPVELQPGESQIGMEFSTGDVDGDGTPDILRLGFRASQLFKSQPGGLPALATLGFLQDPDRLGNTFIPVASTEFTQDRRPDLIAFFDARNVGVVAFGGSILPGRTEEFRVGNPSNGFPLSFAPPFLTDDFDGDGQPELFALRDDGRFNTYEHITPPPTTVTPFLLTNPLSRIVTMDVDNDGDRDIVGTFGNPNVIGWLRNDPGPSFVEVSGNFGGALPYIGTLVVLDEDGDGDEDLVLVPFNAPFGSTTEIQIWNNQGGGVFVQRAGLAVEPLSFQNPFSYLSPSSGDFDGDGDEDIWAEFRNTLFENDGNGNFTQTDFTIRSPLADGARPVDIDLDGTFELVGRRDDNDEVAIWRLGPSGYELDADAVELGWPQQDEGFLVDMDGDGDLDYGGRPILVNRAIDLWAPFLPAIGLDYEVEVRFAPASPSSVTTCFFAVSPTLLPVAFLGPFGSIDLAEPLFAPGITLPADGSPERFSLPVPVDQTLFGVPFVAQATFLNVAVDGTFSLRQSAPIAEVIVR